jgi:hypothetical protein
MLDLAVSFPNNRHLVENYFPTTSTWSNVVPFKTARLERQR